MLTAVPSPDIPLPWPALTVFAGALLALAWYDIRERRLPNILTYPFLVLGLAWVAYAAPTRLIAHALSAVVGLLGLYLLGHLFERRRGYPGLGFGDVKLVSAIGAWLGPSVLAPTLLIASLAALLWAPLQAYRNGQKGSKIRIPLGTFLALAAIGIVFFAQD
ncbi:prepilin peptidase [Kordiimonas marina]|uniref:prepilin peptidase n=1 Tax=Kordiimonas marina TaxID=2872312 RepID=UPI003CCFF1B4|nr:A24 family peptidase [Kordiimonas marina]